MEIPVIMAALKAKPENSKLDRRDKRVFPLNNNKNKLIIKRNESIMNIPRTNLDLRYPFQRSYLKAFLPVYIKKQHHRMKKCVLVLYYVLLKWFL